MKLLYLENCTWELDFIINDLLFDIKNIEFELFNSSNICDLIYKHDIINNNILVLNYCCKLEEVIKTVKIIKPLCIFFLSDEGGNILPHWLILEKYTKFFFRQYNFNNINYSTNNFQIPLGYVKNLLNQKQSINLDNKKMNQRSINAAFIGSVKSDRLYMKEIFEKSMVKTYIKFVDNTWDLSNLPFSQKKIFNLYNNTKFIINGRGNYSLDCFRIYEAIVCGAIPVIVGSDLEINETFNYNNNLPPFVFADSWENALFICNDLLNNPDELQKKQNQIIFWWKNLLLNINSKIKKILPKIK
jgi:hypothetical protein